MATIKINVGSVIGLSDQIQRAKSTVSSVRSSVNTLKSQVDGRIQNRNNIASRFQSITNQLSTVETKISRIKSTVENGANKYYTIDTQVQSWRNGVNGRFASLGAVGAGITGIINTAAVQSADVDSKENSDSTFVKILKDDWKLEGAVLAGSSTITGTIIGFDSSGTAEGELIGGSIKTKSQAKWKPSKGEAVIEKSLEAEGHLAKGSLSGNIGLLGGEIEGTVGSVGATGKIGATLFKDGKFSPTLDAKLKAEAAAAKGSAKVEFGNDDFDAHGKASGTLLGAEAEASGSVGKITYKDETTGQTKTEFGVKGKVGAEAYLAQGKVSGGFTLFGIKIDAGVSGKAGGAGVTAEGKVTTGGISGKVGAGLGLGAGLEISIDWSGFKWENLKFW